MNYIEALEKLKFGKKIEGKCLIVDWVILRIYPDSTNQKHNQFMGFDAKKKTYLYKNNLIGLVKENYTEADLLYNNFAFETCPDYILEDSERQYLRTIIHPFRENIKSIMIVSKESIYGYDAKKEKEMLVIYFKNSTEPLRFPPFPSDTMYKGMERYRAYALDELKLND